MARTLSSNWDGLADHLAASFYEVTKQGGVWVRVKDGVSVRAAVTEADMELSLTWVGAFEDSDTDSQFPTTAAALQSGYPQHLIEAIGLGDTAIGEGAANVARRFEGRTGITKLNSTQVFNGMPPVKINATLLFRAWADPKQEVKAPVDQLVSWSLPPKLSQDGSIIARIAKSGQSAVDALMPSLAPIQIAMVYKGQVFSPLVIESIGLPLGSPTDVNGNYVQQLIPVTLATLTAIDRDDWTNTKKFSL
ncbi:MAG: hypothetical protein CMB99_00685 [Flavobacteriaceae bacterium]|nr:hypothetical protein [Flavobacteriaceae bacterium]|tara:strand:- start:1479 stop:2225 length:747 start_codon:yes stop_codon:yes gene_type:complete